MSRKIIALQDYDHLSDAAFGVFSIKVGTMMDGNAKFPNPPVSPKDIVADSIKFITQIPGKNATSKVTATPKNELRKVIFENLEQTRKYVNYIAEGDLEALLTTGFNVTESLPINFTQAVTKSLKHGRESGTLEVSVYAQKGAQKYNVEVLELNNDAAEARVMSFTKATQLIVTKCVPGKTYQIRVQIEGAEGIEPSAWSIPMSIMSL